MQYGVNRLLLGIVNEPAGIYDYDRGVVAVAFVNNIKIIGPKLSHQHLGIDEVLGATQSDDIHLILAEGLCFHCSLNWVRPSLL
jgi:hypothetical protein